ncbi:MAG: GTPase HflX [Thermodesulfobacteriota bacterium]
MTRSETGNLERLYRRKIPPKEIITLELARTLARLSHELRKGISVLIDRKGKVAAVFLGDSHELSFDEVLGRSRESRYRLRGARLVHTHLKNSGLSENDLVTLVNERLDLMGLIEVRPDGDPGKFYLAHVLPPNHDGKKWQVEEYRDLGQVDVSSDELIRDVEHSLEKSYYEQGGAKDREGVLLVGYSTKCKLEAEESLEELKSLARSANKAVLGSIIQIRKETDPRYLIGKGKLHEAILTARQVGAEKIIFDVELTPAQVKSITDETNLTVMDRTQLILEIFARHATTAEGKLQVKLAQFKYNLPRLVGRGIELSQLGGGIGTRGPGEKKLEEERRRIRKQIDNLESEITHLSKRRERTREKRKETGIPTVTFIGYTNVGKSTLFNALTNSGVVVENKLFSTLVPTTRKIILPGMREILITDTVGFISDLPKELVNAFRATLEELGSSSLLLHVADASDPMVEERIESVNKILGQTGYESIPQMIVLNKSDKTPLDAARRLSRAYGAPLISARGKNAIPEMLGLIEKRIFGETPEDEARGSMALSLHTA